MFEQRLVKTKYLEDLSRNTAKHSSVFHKVFSVEKRYSLRNFPKTVL